MKITAVITTYFPDPARLRENIEAIAPQVNNIIIYNNGGIPDLEDLLSNPLTDSLVILGSGDNTGLPIAFNASFHEAQTLGSDHVLLLDQDSVAPDSLVSTLASHFTDPSIGIAGPRIADRAIVSDPQEALDAETKIVDRVISSGCLISLEAWKAVGGYDEQLKIDWVDFEFCADVRLHGFKILQTSQVALLHELGHRTPSIALPQFAHGRVQAKQFYSTNHSTSRRIDKARSWAMTLKKYQGTEVYTGEKSYIVKTFLRDLLVEPRKLDLLRSYKHGYSLGCSEYQSR